MAQLGSPNVQSAGTGQMERSSPTSSTIGPARRCVQTWRFRTSGLSSALGVQVFDSTSQDGRFVFSSAAEMMRYWPDDEITPSGTGEFKAEVARRTLLHSRVTRVTATSHRCDRGASEGEAAHSRAVTIGVVLDGDCSLSRGADSITATAGDVFVHRGISHFAFSTPSDVLCTTVDPVQVLVGPGLESDIFELHPASALAAAFGGLASTMLRDVDVERDEGDGELEVDERAPVTELLEPTLLAVQRLVVAEATRGQPEHVPSRVALRERTKQLIVAHMNDPDLDADLISEALGVSRRWLFRVFDDQPETISRTIRRVRIEAAAKSMVQDPHQPLWQVAARHGYRRRDNFTRAFRAERGQSVQQFRDNI